MLAAVRCSVSRSIRFRESSAQALSQVRNNSEVPTEQNGFDQTSELSVDTAEQTTVKYAPPIRKIDRSKVPTLNEHDLEEKFISGGGPGGQKVNKAVNCCQLRHRPTNIIVKVHQSRSLQQNREIARELLINKLDNLYNGEQSVENQKRRLAMYRESVRRSQSDIRRAMKQEYKMRSIRPGDSIG